MSLARIDSRSLALFRIALGVLLLADLLSRARNLRAHYTDAGVLPRAALFDWIGPQRLFSPHSYLGDSWWQIVLFAIAAVAALALVIGYRTRMATMLSWFLLVSLQARNPAVIDGADNLLRLLLLWSVLLPLGVRWSVDRAHAADPPPRFVSSAATLGILLQICLMYWFSGVLKWNPTWMTDRTAVAMVLNVDHLTTDWGRALLAYPGLVRTLSPATVLLELLGPLLLWVPWRIGPVRFAVALVLISFHLIGMAPALLLGPFPWVCATALLLFLPGWMWDRISTRTLSALGRLQRALEFLPRRLPAPRSRTWRFPGHRFEAVGVALLLALALAWNIRSLDPGRFGGLVPPPLELAGRILGINQSWTTFAPLPPADDGWYVMPARAGDGQEFDAWRGGPVTWTKPRDVAATFGDKRWNKYLSNISLIAYEHHRPLFGAYLCRESRRTKGRPSLESFEIIFISERFDAPLARPRPLLLWKQRCQQQ